LAECQEELNMSEEIVQGTITRIKNKISSKGVPYTIYDIITLDGKELSIFYWQNNLSQLEKLAKFEITKTHSKDGTIFHNINKMEVISNENVQY
jgi:hypothetical protein